MKELLFIVIVGIVGTWGCLEHMDSTPKKFVGKKQKEKKQREKEIQTVEPPSGKYYTGVRKRKAYFWSYDGKKVFVPETEIDIFLEVDFSDGQPLLNIKTSGDLNECEQSPAGAFVKSLSRKQDRRVENAWQADWKNAEGQRFVVILTQFSGYRNPYPGFLEIRFSALYNTETDSGRKRVSHNLGAAFGYYFCLYRPTDSLKKYEKFPMDEGVIPPKEVSAKFSVGKICPNRG